MIDSSTREPGLVSTAAAGPGRPLRVAFDDLPFEDREHELGVRPLVDDAKLREERLDGLPPLGEQPDEEAPA